MRKHCIRPMVFAVEPDGSVEGGIIITVQLWHDEIMTAVRNHITHYRCSLDLTIEMLKDIEYMTMRQLQR